MSEQNKGVVLRLLNEVWAAGNVEVADELIAVEYRSHLPDVFPARMSRWTGSPIVRVEVNTYRSGFPDLAVEVHELIAEGDAVVAFWRVGGTNSRTTLLTPGGDDIVDEEIESTSKELSASGTSLFRFNDAKIIEAVFAWTPLPLLDQVRLFARGVHVLGTAAGFVSVVAPPA